MDQYGRPGGPARRRTRWSTPRLNRTATAMVTGLNVKPQPANWPIPAETASPTTMPMRPPRSDIPGNRRGAGDRRRALRRRGVRDGAQPLRHPRAARLPAVHAQPRADRQSRQPRAGGDAVGAHPAQRRRDEPVDRQAGARHRRLRHRLAARRARSRRRATRSPPAAIRGRRDAPLLTSPPASAATRRSTRRALLGPRRSRSTTSAPTSGRSTPRARSWS